MKRCMLLFLLAFPMFASADVTFYSKCDYKGPGVATLKRSDPCLKNDRFDDVVSSISIRETFEITTPTASVEQRSNSGITLYTECDFKGRSAVLGDGDYNLAQLSKLGITNNTVSSVKVPEGYSVKLFENDFLRGRAGRLVQDHTCLSRDNFDDIVSSVQVVRDANAPVQKPAVVAVPDSAITLYSECNYRGKAIHLQEGEYTTTNLQKLGLANNTISSIRVSDGFQVELFENDFYRGASGTLRQNDNCLVDDRFNDTISSLVVSKDPYAVAEAKEAAAAKDTRVGVTVFGHCNYKGGSVKLRVGEYDLAALNKARIKDNVISSFKVEKGFQVTLHDSDDMSDRGKVFTENDSCLDDDRLNEKVSSLVVAPIAAVKKETQLTQIAVPTAAVESNEIEVTKALACVEQYVGRGLCDSHRWANISKRCSLEQSPLMTDGYLRGHVDAGNCKPEYWDELSRRVANPRLR